MQKAPSVRKKLVVGGVKLVALVAVFFLLQNRILRLETRSAVASSEPSVREAHEENELVRLRQNLRESLAALATTRDDFRKLSASLDARESEALRQLDRGVDDRLVSLIS